MSTEAIVAAKWLAPGLGLSGGAIGLAVIAAAQGDLDLVKEYGSMALLFFVLLWMTQVLTKRLDDLLKVLQAVQSRIEAQANETTEMRATLERQERRLEDVEDAIRGCPGIPGEEAE